MSRVKILIVEDEPLVAEDIAAYLRDVDFIVAGIANSGTKALELLAETKPDAALLDINLGGKPDGVEVAQEINKLYHIPFVFLTSHADRSTIERVKETRPSGYLLKPFDENDLLTSLEIAVFNHMSARTNFSPAFNITFINSHLPNPISEREFEILNLLREGKSNKEIGEAIFLSVNTIKTHLLNLYEKLDVRNRTEVMFKLNKLLG
ncbi:MAG: response regulator transcription factor [Flavobacteriales bacterium]|nr:response regulator transcription factor [Flavobacteriales bacterium]